LAAFEGDELSAHIAGWLYFGSRRRSSLSVAENRCPLVLALLLQPVDAGPEYVDHKLAHRIERALVQAAAADILAGLQWSLEHDTVAAGDLERTDGLTLLDRRAHRTGIDDLGTELLRQCARDQQANGRRAHQRDAALCAAIKLGLADRFALRE